MAVKLKELCNTPELLAGGHRACPGCAGPTAIRQVLLAAGKDIVVGCATGCMEVSTTIFPYTAWRTPFIHSAFENAAATISGVEAAYEALKRRGKVTKDLHFIAFGGDGGTFDIGFQSLSGAMERGHRMLYVCYDNEAYMNTGIQRSSATPKGAATTTAPAGKVRQGKEQHRKDLTACIVAHDVPYVAQASVHNPIDLMNKVQAALAVDGPSFINILAPCHRGWRFNMNESIDIAKEAAETCYWPLFEVVNHVWKINYKPKEKKPLVDWLKRQKRFEHLFKKPENEKIIAELQAEIDRKWAELLEREATTNKA
ncbi:MAG TPA: thiamine pyrophosphate-dependent enzyme [Planctomycetota bacterium]|nr:thiamine pyrophosphate-dependent enzyme [Planctomycetota bacterium]